MAIIYDPAYNLAFHQKLESFKYHQGRLILRGRLSLFYPFVQDL